MSEATKPRTDREVADEPPPFLGRWGWIYAVVLFYLFALIAGFWTIGRVLTP